jgi:ribosomal RNA-processing protein 8
LIAEVQSRLSDSDAFVDTVVSMGFAVREKDFKNSHFLYFEFVKEREHSQKNSAPSRSEPLLKACKYKKR